MSPGTRSPTGFWRICRSCCVPLGAIGALFGTVPTLLAAQSLALALAAWPLSLIGARRFGPLGGVAAALAYLLYPNLGHVATYEFHPGAIAMLPLAYALLRARSAARAGALPRPRADLAVRRDRGMPRQPLAADRGDRRGGAAREWRPGAATALALLIGSLLYFALSLALQPLLGGALSASADLHYGKWGGSPLGVLARARARPAARDRPPARRPSVRATRCACSPRSRSCRCSRRATCASRCRRSRSTC